MQRHQTLKLVGEFDAVFRLALGVGVLGQIVRMRQVVDAGEQRAEHLAVGDDAADRHTAEIDAMIAALAADQPEARAVALGAVVGDRGLQRGLNRFRAGIGEHDMLEACRR